MNLHWHIITQSLQFTLWITLGAVLVWHVSAIALLCRNLTALRILCALPLSLFTSQLLKSTSLPNYLLESSHLNSTHLLHSSPPIHLSILCNPASAKHSTETLLIKVLPVANGLFSLLISCTCACVLVAQSCPTLYNPMDCSLWGSLVHGILQARILE